MMGEQHRVPSRVQLRGFGFRHLIRDRHAVKGVDLAIEPGERVLLLGASGAGKSTLLHAIAGLLDSDHGDLEGELLVDGRPPTPVAGGHGLTGTGIVFQDPDSQLVMSRCGDEVAFGLENAGVAPDAIWPRVRRALDSVGFDYPHPRSTQALSGGERQRLVLAGALALRPRLLLLDEPTANLDPGGAAQVMSAIDEATRDRSATMIIIEHRIARAVPLVDRVVVLDQETGVLADGPPDQVLTTYHDQLAAAGVWVDDEIPWRPERSRQGVGAPLLRLAEPRRSYHAGAPLLPEPVDFTVTAGSISAIVGPNGVGKSTLAMMAAGLTTPLSGAVEPTEELITGLRPRTAARPIHRWPSEQLAPRIGAVFQNPEHQFLTSSVRDEVRLGPRHSKAAYARRADALLERLGLNDLADANPFTLSGGEKRRLSVATALAGRPRVVILDEPTFGQDRRTWIQLAQLFTELAEDGTALIFVTHDQLLTAAIAETVLDLGADRSPRQAVA